MPCSAGEGGNKNDMNIIVTGDKETENDDISECSSSSSSSGSSSSSSNGSCRGLNIQDGQFCRENSCIDKALKEIYCKTDSKDTTINMDCFIYLCGFLSNVSSSTQKRLKKQNNNNNNNNNNSKGNVFRLRCICKREEHEVFTEKKGELCVSDTLVKSFTSKGCAIPMSSMVLCQHDAPQYHRLPDFSRYISAILQKHHVQHLASKVSCLKGVNKTHDRNALKDRSQSVRNKPTTQKKKRESSDLNSTSVNISGSSACRGIFSYLKECDVAIRAHGLCCVILQESIPCLKRCKRSNRPMQFIHELCSQAEVSAIINMLHGTLLALYPRALNSQTYPCRVQLAWRLRNILCSTVDVQMNFIEANIGLVKLCMMEYCNNVIPDFLEPEYKTLCKMQPTADSFEGICSSICNNFRRIVLITGMEVSTVPMIS